MRWNPVYKKELTVSSRSIRMTAILFFFNSVLATVALFNMYSVVEQVKLTAEIQYSRFLELYMFVSAVEFIMLLFIMPALTSGSISGERERQTLDLMLTTTMSPMEIVLGKLMTSLTTMLLLAVAALPVQSLVFVYGGITVMDMACLFLFHVIVAAFTGGIGIFLSSLLKRSAVATVCTYTVIILLVAGTWSANLFAYRMALNEVSSYSYAMNATMQQAGSGGLIYLLLLNPAVTFYALMNGQAGNGDIRLSLGQWFGSVPDNFVIEHWAFFSLWIQLVLAVLLAAAAIYTVTPIRSSVICRVQNRRGKKEEKNDA